MSATALTIVIYYSVLITAGILWFAYWFVTRKREDDIWRWILSIIGSLVFCTIFWLAYWFGTFDGWWLNFVVMIGLLVWLWMFFSHSTTSVLDKAVFCAFGAVAFGMIMAGGHSAGVRGWWGMAIPFYGLSFYLLYHMLVPD